LKRVKGKGAGEETEKSSNTGVVELRLKRVGKYQHSVVPKRPHAGKKRTG